MKRYLILLLLALCSCKSMRDLETNPTYKPAYTHTAPKPSKASELARDNYIAELNATSMLNQMKPQQPVKYAPIPPPPKKASVFRKVFPKKPVVAANARRVKLKNITVQNTTNQQTALGGSTIGAATQSGNDASKVKESAVSEAKTDNTAGQGAKQEVKQTSEAKNVLKKGIPLWWILLGVAVLAVCYGGYQMFRRSVWPFRY